MKLDEKIKKAIAHLNPDLISEMMKFATIKTIPKDTEILREGQYVTVIPIVLDGLIKVFTRHEDKELLLYYIKPNESCIMSFAASLTNVPIKVCATVEENTTAMLFPVDKILGWTKQFPDINTLFFQQYNQRYNELIDIIHQVLFDKMDKRLFKYLQDKKIVTHKNPIKISHRQIANELGTAREVISRVMKKLENEGKLKQQTNGIKIL